MTLRDFGEFNFGGNAKSGANVAGQRGGVQRVEMQILHVAVDQL